MSRYSGTFYIILSLIAGAFFIPTIQDASLAIIGAIIGGGMLLNGLSKIGSGKRANKRANESLNNAIGKSKEYASGVKAQYQGMFKKMASNNKSFLDLSNDLNNERKKTYFDTNEGKGFLATINERNKEGREGAMNSANLMGMSQEAMLSMLGNVNNNSSQSLRSLAGRSDERKASLRSQYMGALGQYGQGVNNLFMQQYGIDRDALSSMTGASLSAQNTQYNRQAANQQSIGQGIGNLINMGGQAGWFDGKSA